MCWQKLTCALIFDRKTLFLKVNFIAQAPERNVTKIRNLIICGRMKTRRSCKKKIKYSFKMVYLAHAAGDCRKD